ncbi:hypothetical protein [Agarilytica rhodophyticola]|uniref:hypothetical protein n=1 Tax=Agarilytica rhodophyticola TaxID=1737490 RepID=UPI000B3412A5|nr:hypothetical protein [Agarilytica rhodophyticola]
MMINVHSRWQAFAVHLGISFLLFLALAGVIKLLWYPGLLFNTEGGWEGIKLIAGVDLVIGPLLTLLVYNTAKKELKRDLLIIVLMQLFCICGGMFVVERNRPIAIIYANDIFYTATRTQFEEYDIAVDSVPLLRGDSWLAWISLDLPDDPSERRKATVERYMESDIRRAIELYQPYETNKSRLRNEGWSWDVAIERGYSPAEHLKSESIRFFNLITRYDLYKIAVDVGTGKLIEVIPTRDTKERRDDNE